MKKVNLTVSAACAIIVGTLALTPAAFAGGSQVVSARNPASPLAVPGNGSSAGAIVSGDGRYVVFNSTANDLVPGDNGLFYSDVFLRDHQNNSTALISVNMAGTGGANGNSIVDDISTNNRYILFESDATNLVAGSTNAVNNIYVRDVLNGATMLVSANTNGVPGSRASSKPAMTPDGRYVAFVSMSTNLAATTYNGVSNVFVRDLQLGTTALVSVGVSAISDMMNSPVITPDGRYVAFVSSAPGMVPPFSSSHSSEVYVRDLQGGTTIRISTNFDGQTASMMHPAISSDGRYVTFKQTNSGGIGYVVLYDAVTASNTLVNVDSNSVVLNTPIFPPAYLDDGYGPEFTSGGSAITYIAATNSTNSAVYQWNIQNHATALLSLNSSGTVALGISAAFTLTPDGRYLAYLLNVPNTGNAGSNGYHLYLRDLQIGTNYLVDVDTNGIASTDLMGTAPSMSSDGRYIAFGALDGNLVAADTNQSLDVFLRDMTNRTTELVSCRHPIVISQTGSGISTMTQTALTPDGRWLVFSSRADDLVTNDFNGEQDVFVRDLQTGSNILVSVGTNGASPLGGPSGSPAISSDGRYIVFTSSATNLFDGDTNRAADLFIRDMQAGVTTPLFVNTAGGNAGSGDSSAPSISADGRYVTFLLRSNNVTTVPIWLDILSNNFVVLTNVNTTIPPSMNTNGQIVAFANNSSQLFVRDMQSGSNLFMISGSTGSSLAVSPRGTRLLYTFVQSLVPQTFVANIPSGSQPFGQSRTPMIISQSQWSADDRYVAFVTSTNVAASDSNTVNDVYLLDLQTSNITLVSLNAAHTGSGNAASDSSSVSGDGRFVVFRSLANDIVSGVTNSPNFYRFDRVTGSNTVVGAEPFTMPTWSSWLMKPAVSSNGDVVAFRGLKPNQVSGLLDLNRLPDLFVVTPATLLVDSDGDGIPDWWLIQYFGHPDGQPGDLSRAQDDADGDGMSNLQEYLSGTDPRSGSSVIRVNSTPVIGAGALTLTWPAIAGKSYRVQYKVHLEDAEWLDQPGTMLVGSTQVSFTVPINGASRFYRVVTVNQ